MITQNHEKANGLFHPIIVRPEPEGRFTAEPIGVPEIREEADSAEAAVNLAAQRLSMWQGAIRWVPIDGLGAGAMMDFAGHAADDPDHAAYLEEIARFRKQANGLECSNTSSTPTT